MSLLQQNSLELANIVDLLSYRALHQAKQVAYTFLVDGETKEISLTYQELDEKAKAIACELLSIRATGERALLLYPSGLEFITAFFGCLYAGVIAVPVYPPRRNQRMTRLQAIAKDAQATIALTTTSILTEIERSFKQEPELAALHCLATENLASNTHNWQPTNLRGNTLAFLQYTSGSTGTPKGVMITHANLLHNEEMIKKAFQHTQESVIVGWLPLFHDMGLIGNVLQPLYLGVPSIFMSPVAFLQKPWRWLNMISRYQATTSGGPNFAYELCVNKITASERASLDLSSWNLAFNGAEPVRAETLEQFARTFAVCGFRRKAFYPCYGMAETTLFVSGRLKTSPLVLQTVNATALEQNQVVVAESPNQKNPVLVSCGKAWLGQQVMIVNPETLLECLPNQVGEIWVAGASVASGYWKRPQETEQAFKAYLADTGAGPFLRTGDLGYLQDGELFITGRLKDVIIIRGRNHYPQDIELTVERSHPALRVGYGAAFAVNVNGQEQLVVVQEVERSYLRHLNVDEVVKAIRSGVSYEHELQVYSVVLVKTASIPKTSSGKIQRHACRIGFVEGSLDVVGEWTANPGADLVELATEVESLYEQLQNIAHQQQSKDSFESREQKLSQNSNPTQQTIEAWLITHLALYLKVQPREIDIREPFTAYGLDSSVALTITGELAQWLGCELEPTLFWEYPNIKVLAQYLEAECHLLRQVSAVSV